jgi:hypothetical protein
MIWITAALVGLATYYGFDLLNHSHPAPVTAQSSEPSIEDIASQMPYKKDYAFTPEYIAQFNEQSQNIKLQENSQFKGMTIAEVEKTLQIDYS